MKLKSFVSKTLRPSISLFLIVAMFFGVQNTSWYQKIADMYKENNTIIRTQIYDGDVPCTFSFLNNEKRTFLGSFQAYSVPEKKMKYVRDFKVGDCVIFARDAVGEDSFLAEEYHIKDIYFVDDKGAFYAPGEEYYKVFFRETRRGMLIRTVLVTASFFAGLSLLYCVVCWVGWTCIDAIGLGYKMYKYQIASFANDVWLKILDAASTYLDIVCPQAILKN